MHIGRRHIKSQMILDGFCNVTSTFQNTIIKIKTISIYILVLQYSNHMKKAYIFVIFRMIEKPLKRFIIIILLDFFIQCKIAL